MVRQLPTSEYGEKELYFGRVLGLIHPTAKPSTASQSHKSLYFATSYKFNKHFLTVIESGGKPQWFIVMIRNSIWPNAIKIFNLFSHNYQAQHTCAENQHFFFSFITSGRKIQVSKYVKQNMISISPPNSTNNPNAHTYIGKEIQTPDLLLRCRSSGKPS